MTHQIDFLANAKNKCSGKVAIMYGCGLAMSPSRDLIFRLSFLTQHQQTHHWSHLSQMAVSLNEVARSHAGSLLTIFMLK